PVPFRATRVRVPRRGLAGETDEEHVDPAVAVEVAREGEEVVRVSARIEALRRIDLALRREVWAAVPVRPGDHVGESVAIEIGEARALAQEVGAERQALAETLLCARATTRDENGQRGREQGSAHR